VNNILLLDTETTGTDEGSVCIEVAVALYSVKHAAVLRSYSSLIQANSNEAVHVNRIPSELLLDAPLPQAVWAGVAKFAAHADAIVAYGAEFDRRFVPDFALCGKPWVCAMDDLHYNRGNGKRESLVSLALAHDVGVASSHRAAADVELLARLFTRTHDMGVDLAEFLAYGMRPKALFVIADRNFNAARNELAKVNKFDWNKPYAPKEWSRTMAIEDAEKLPFAVEQVQ
jgi:DNA polymerase III epsilon subunit-like protein